MNILLPIISQVKLIFFEEQVLNQEQVPFTRASENLKCIIKELNLVNSVCHLVNSNYGY